jgi:xylulokinase
MEGVVYSLKDCLELIIQMGVPAGGIMATGGGARSKTWRQLQADVFGLPVHRNRVDEGAAFGAALLGGVAARVFANVNEACSRIQLDPEVAEPDAERHRLYKHYHAVYTALYAANAPAMHRLHQLGSQ